MMSTDEEALLNAKVLFDIATTPQPGGETQTVAKMQVMLIDLIDAHKLASYPTASQIPSPVAGYRPQSDAAIALVNEFKVDEERLLRKLDAFYKECAEETARTHKLLEPGASFTDWLTQYPPPYDEAWLGEARRGFQIAFMALNRAVFQPARVKLPEDEP